MNTFLLGKASSYLLLLAFVALVCGLLTTTFGGPCNEYGFYTSAAALGVATLGCAALLTRSLRLRTNVAWLQFGCSIIASVYCAFMAFAWTLGMCRAI